MTIRNDLNLVLHARFSSFPFFLTDLWPVTPVLILRSRHLRLVIRIVLTATDLFLFHGCLKRMSHPYHSIPHPFLTRYLRLQFLERIFCPHHQIVLREMDACRTELRHCALLVELRPELEVALVRRLNCRGHQLRHLLRRVQTRVLVLRVVLFAHHHALEQHVVPFPRRRLHYLLNADVEQRRRLQCHLLQVVPCLQWLLALLQVTDIP